MIQTITTVLLILSLADSVNGNEKEDKGDAMTVTPNVSYEPFLLEESEFGIVRDLKQRVMLRTVLAGSLPRRCQAYRQEAFMPSGELFIVTYLLCESSLEACAVMFHDALTSAEPGRLLVVGPDSKAIQSLGDSEAVDDVYIFRGSKARNRASLMFRTEHLLVCISVLNDPKNVAEQTRDSLARLVLKRANEVIHNQDLISPGKMAEKKCCHDLQKPPNQD